MALSTERKQDLRLHHRIEEAGCVEGHERIVAKVKKSTRVASARARTASSAGGQCGDERKNDRPFQSRPRFGIL